MGPSTTKHGYRPVGPEVTNSEDRHPGGMNNYHIVVPPTRRAMAVVFQTACGGVSMRPPAVPCQCPVQTPGHAIQASLAKTLARHEEEALSYRPRVLRKWGIAAPCHQLPIRLAADDMHLGALHQPMRGRSHVIS